METVGWKQASTFTGFCDKHDAPLFADIETKSWASSSRQCFLVCYRAICHEVYEKRAALAARSYRKTSNDDKKAGLRDLIDRGVTQEEQRQVQHAVAVQAAGTAHGLRNLSAIKAEMDAAIRADTFSDWSFYAVQFRGDLSIASTGSPSPNIDLHGNEIQTLHDRHTSIQPLPFGMLALDDGAVIVLGWRTADSAPRQFFASLLGIEDEARLQILAQFMFAYVSNTYFSKSWWDSRRVFVQDHIRRLAAEANPYYYPKDYIHRHVVPWKFVGETYIGSV